MTVVPQGAGFSASGTGCDSRSDDGACSFHWACGLAQPGSIRCGEPAAAIFRTVLGARRFGG